MQSVCAAELHVSIMTGGYCSRALRLLFYLLIGDSCNPLENGEIQNGRQRVSWAAVAVRSRERLDMGVKVQYGEYWGCYWSCWLSGMHGVLGERTSVGNRLWKLSVFRSCSVQWKIVSMGLQCRQTDREVWFIQSCLRVCRAITPPSHTAPMDSHRSEVNLMCYNLWTVAWYMVTFILLCQMIIHAYVHCPVTFCFPSSKT